MFQIVGDPTDQSAKRANLAHGTKLNTPFMGARIRGAAACAGSGNQDPQGP
jgi:hypothetical protein